MNELKTNDLNFWVKLGSKHICQCLVQVHATRWIPGSFPTIGIKVTEAITSTIRTDLTNTTRKILDSDEMNSVVINLIPTKYSTTTKLCRK